MVYFDLSGFADGYLTKTLKPMDFKTSEKVLNYKTNVFHDVWKITEYNEN
jgi:hypothetical protein